MIVLASASPRRRVLLEKAGLRFDVDPADVDESPVPGLGAEDFARLLAERKALTVAARHAKEALVVGADTIVVTQSEAGGEESGSPGILGKPSSPEEAHAMLSSLSETRHRVITAVSVVRGGSTAPLTAAETTWVTMRRIEAAEVEAYVSSGEWKGKAGGYAIQETADAFVTRLEGGGFDNVVGLPVALTLGLLRSSGEPASTVAERKPQG